MKYSIYSVIHGMNHMGLQLMYLSEIKIAACDASFLQPENLILNHLRLVIHANAFSWCLISTITKVKYYIQVLQLSNLQPKQTSKQNLLC